MGNKADLLIAFFQMGMSKMGMSKKYDDKKYRGRH